MTDIVSSVIKKIKEEIFLNPMYSVDEISWHIQDCINYPKNKGNDFLLSEQVLEVLDKTKFEWLSKEKTIEFSCYFLQNGNLFEWLYENLADDRSRITLEWLVKSHFAYMVCGEVYKEILDLSEEVILIDRDERITNNKHVYCIDKYNIYTFEQEIYDTWIREQYSLKGICEPNKGDIVFSIGAFYGETSI